MKNDNGMGHHQLLQYIDRLSSPSPPLHIDVCDSNLTDDHAIRLADALTYSQQKDDNDGNYSEGGGVTLNKLRLRSSQITSKGSFSLAEEAIGGVAGSTSALEHLDLGHTIEIAEDVDGFTFAMHLLLSAADNLKHLDLEGCLGKLAGVALASVIAVHGESLESLNLRNNALEDDETTCLATKLSSMTSDCKSLARIDLGLNYVGDRGAMAFA